MKKRVHELAKEYGMSSKDFLILLKDEIKLETAESLKNLSGLSVDDVERVRKYFEEMTAPKESVEEKGVALNKKLLEEDEIFEEERASKKSKNLRAVSSSGSSIVFSAFQSRRAAFGAPNLASRASRTAARSSGEHMISCSSSSDSTSFAPASSAASNMSSAEMFAAG